jgi:hypothetical protein
MLGYYAKNNQAGALGHAKRQERTVDFWNCTAVYALFDREAVIYVGEGALGPRLLAHWRHDHLAGRWDSFSWLSPHGYEHTAGKPAKVTPSKPGKNITAAKLVQLLELIAIRLGSPTTNRQLPRLARDVKWMQQVRAEHAQLSLEDKVDLLLDQSSA